MRTAPRPLFAGKTAIVCALLATAALLGCSPEREVQAQPGPPVRWVATRSLEPGPFDRTLPEKLGTLEAAELRTLGFEVSGRLAEVVREGTVVRADQVIARLEARVEQALVRQAELMLEEARSDRERIRGLSRSGAASTKELETAQTRAEMRSSELRVAAERLEQRALRAGIDGVVSDVQVEPGELVTPQTQVATVLDTSHFKLVIGVPGFQVAQVRPGGRAWVRVPAAGPERYAGTIERVASAALPGQHLFEVEIHFDAEPGEGAAKTRLLPGMNAWAELVVESFEAALVVPLDAMVQRGGRRVVFFVDQGRAVQVPVEDAPLVAEQLVLPGDLPYRELVVRGQHDLTSGERVEVDGRVLREASDA